MIAKKSLGQNFLVDQNIINKISDSINAKENDLIVEIGPGMGALTKKLIEKKSIVLCYEIDTDMKKYLDNLNSDKLIINYKDILNCNIKEDIKNYEYNNLFIVGNLPYYITTPIIKHIINQNLNVKEMIFMIQKEVADRFTASCGSSEYGSITLYLNYYFDVNKLFVVNKNCFNPVPKVESAIIKLERKEAKNIDIDKYFKLINDSFRLKRKTLKNNLKDYNFEKILEVLKNYGFDEKVRAEELSEEVFLSIYKIL